MERLEESFRSGDLDARFEAVRTLYRLEEPFIQRGEYNPYFAGSSWAKVFTPIEDDVWFSIRRFYLPMYPQYPVGSFFVDFGDPRKRIAIECDGFEWHNTAKDAKRDAQLKDLGWRVIRIPGWRCVLDEDDEDSSHNVLREISRIFYEDRQRLRNDDEEQRFEKTRRHLLQQLADLDPERL